MNIPDEAVQAAINAWFEETREHVKMVEPLPEQARRMRLALAAAYPFMEAIPSSHRLIPQSPTDTMLETMAFNLSSEFGFDFTIKNKEFALAVYKQAWELGIKLPAAPPPRAQALEEAARYHDKEAEYYSASNGALDGVPFKLVAHFHRMHAAAIRALSSQPVAATRPTGGSNHGE